MRTLHKEEEPDVIEYALAAGFIAIALSCILPAISGLLSALF
jgi:Flp pilus assembly pilin Flp